MRQAFFRLRPCDLAAARDCGRAALGSGGARFLAADLEPLAASLAGGASGRAARTGGTPGLRADGFAAELLPRAARAAAGAPAAGACGAADAAASFPLAAAPPLALFRPHRPKVRTGAAASSA